MLHLIEGILDFFVKYENGISERPISIKESQPEQ